MKAILVNDDQSLRWDNVPDPQIRPDEVLVKIHAAAVNRADLMQRAGDYPPPPGCPEWMGLEIAGASGLASVVIPMAKAFGARVITTVLSEEKAKEIEHLHADRVVISPKENIAEVLKEELDAGHPVDLTIDCLGGRNMGECLPYLQRWGRWIMIATLAGDVTEVNLKNLYVRNIRLIGSTLRARTPAFKAELLRSLVRDVWPKIENGELRPTVWKVLPITAAEEAHELLQSGRSAGKVVLTVPAE